MRARITVLCSNVFAILVISKIVISLPTYEFDDDSAHGIRIAGNGEFTVWASNAYQRYALSFHPYNNSATCILKYPYTDLYIYSLDIVTERQNVRSTSPSYRFIQVGEDMSTHDVYFLMTVFNRTQEEDGNNNF